MIDHGDPRAMERLLSDRDWRRTVAPSVVDDEDVERAAESGDLPSAPEGIDRERGHATPGAVTTHASRDNRRNRRWSGSAAEELARVVEERRS